MSYEALVNETRTLTQTEKLDLLAVIVGMLKESTGSELAVSGSLTFPHIDAQMPISDDTMSMVIGRLPEDFDVEKASEEMWDNQERNLNAHQGL